MTVRDDAARTLAAAAMPEAQLAAAVLSLLAQPRLWLALRCSAPAVHNVADAPWSDAALLGAVTIAGGRLRKPGARKESS